jgi:hypothetical protein
MRTNGFIFIALGFTVATWAGPPGYLPSVGPVALRFERIAPASPTVRLPALAMVTPTATDADFHLDTVVDLPAAPPSEPAPARAPLLNDSPITAPDALPGAPTNSMPVLVGATLDSSGLVTPQMFLRFFTTPQGGGAREAIVVPPPGFNPASPPTPSSTAIYSQPKP